MDDPRLYADDLTVGRRFPLGRHEVTEDAIREFAQEWDPLPFHVDADAAQDTHFGGLVASGVHTLAISQRLVAEALTLRAAVLAGRGVTRGRWLRPVRPGTVVTGWVEVIAQQLRDDGRGTVLWRQVLTDAGGAVVAEIDVDVLLERRPAGG